MNTLINLQDRILNLNSGNFKELALDVFDFQSKNNVVYSQYLKLLHKQDIQPVQLAQIPFLPAEIFKHRIIKSGDWNEDIIFESSGTTQLLKSKHYVRSLNWYYQIAKSCFEYHYGRIENYEFIGLLPSSEERPNSSLVSMFNSFSKGSKSVVHESSFINDHQALYNLLSSSEYLNKKIILIGLSFALLDFVNNYLIENTNMIVIETGGMKGNGRKTDKEILLGELRKGFPNAEVHSEYGMTELMSQAYALDGKHYSSAPVVNFLISDPSDPTVFLPYGKRGIINVIDLGNINTCSFLQTGDLGIINENQQLEVLGRYNPDEVRGCIQMYE